MGLQYRKSSNVNTKGTRINLSGSKNGAGLSLSQRIGPLTLNTRGTGSIRVMKGVSFRFGKRNSGIAAAFIALVMAVILITFRLLVLAARVTLLITAWAAKWAWFGSKLLFQKAHEMWINHKTKGQSKKGQQS